MKCLNCNFSEVKLFSVPECLISAPVSTIEKNENLECISIILFSIHSILLFFTQWDHPYSILIMVENRKLVTEEEWYID